MSILAGFRWPSGSAAASPTTTMVNIGAAQISGQASNAGLIVCLYVYDYTNHQWIPMAAV